MSPTGYRLVNLAITSVHTEKRIYLVHRADVVLDLYSWSLCAPSNVIRKNKSRFLFFPCQWSLTRTRWF